MIRDNGDDGFDISPSPWNNIATMMYLVRFCFGLSFGYVVVWLWSITIFDSDMSNYWTFLGNFEISIILCVARDQLVELEKDLPQNVIKLMKTYQLVSFMARISIVLFNIIFYICITLNWVNQDLCLWKHHRQWNNILCGQIENIFPSTKFN